jgi:hypothetical protein
MLGQILTVERRLPPHIRFRWGIKLHHSVAAVAGFRQNDGGLSIDCEWVPTRMGRHGGVLAH